MIKRYILKSVLSVVLMVTLICFGAWAADINYQGRLTDSMGAPVNGTRDFTFQFWDGPDPATDSQVGSDIMIDDITVTDGIYNIKIPVTDSWFNGQALWLRVKVDTDPWMTPLQEILPVPSTLNIKTNNKTYIWVSGNDIRKYSETAATNVVMDAVGGAYVYSGDAANQYFYLPITLPGVINGKNVTLERVDIYYVINAPETGFTCIDKTSLRKQTGVRNSVDLVIDNTDYCSLDPTSYSLIPTSNNVLTSDQGIIYLGFYGKFASGTDNINIGGARLTLSH